MEKQRKKDWLTKGALALAAIWILNKLKPPYFRLGTQQGGGYDGFFAPDIKNEREFKDLMSRLGIGFDGKTPIKKIWVPVPILTKNETLVFIDNSCEDPNGNTVPAGSTLGKLTGYAAMDDGNGIFTLRYVSGDKTVFPECVQRGLSPGDWVLLDVEHKQVLNSVSGFEVADLIKLVGKGILTSI